MLVLIASQVMLEFTPTGAGGSGLLASMFGMDMGHYAGSELAVLSGVVGFSALQKNE
jgi:hypothetical protein